MKNIKEFASKPKLIEIILDDPSLLETYAEPITFHTYDIVSLSTYFDFYNSCNNSEFETLEKMIRKLILDDKGKAVLAVDEDLPIDIAAASISKIGEILGKSQSKSSIQKTGEPQK